MAGRDLDLSTVESATDLSAARNCLLAIAVDRYAHWRPLRNAVKDATEVAVHLTRHFMFGEESVTRLYDEDATLENITTKLHELQGLSAESNLVVYLAGHGVRELGGAWIPADAKHRGDWFHFSVLLEYLAAIPVRHMLVIVDSCFAGTLLDTQRSRTAKPAVPASGAQRLLRTRSRYAMSSGRDETVLDGAPGANSPFAASLKYCLSIATDGISAVELSQNVMMHLDKGGQSQMADHRRLAIEGDDGGAFCFPRRPDTKADAKQSLRAFAKPYFDAGGKLIPPARRREVQQHFDEYDAYFARHSGTERRELQRENTLAYLQRWQLDVRGLQRALTELDFWREDTIDGVYCDELADALQALQADSMMLYRDGYFGELTYQDIVHRLLESGAISKPE